MVVRGDNYRKQVCYECGEDHAQSYFKWYNGIKYCKDCYKKMMDEKDG